MVLHRRPHQHSTTLSCTTAMAFLLIIITSSSAIRVNITPSQLGGPHQQQQAQVVDGMVSGGSLVEKRELVGSAPPRCRSKCGRCSPCKAVHVAIQPGLSIPLEYYPEAWRCKCGTNLFMP